MLPLHSGRFSRRMANHFPNHTWKRSEKWSHHNTHKQMLLIELCDSSMEISKQVLSILPLTPTISKDSTFGPTRSKKANITPKTFRIPRKKLTFMGSRSRLLSEDFIDATHSLPVVELIAKDLTETDIKHMRMK
jgi:hypothetical protein